MKKRFYLFIPLLLLISCSMWVRTRSLFGDKMDIHVFITEDANLNHAFAVDVIYVYDKTFLKKLLELPAQQWFQKRQQLWNDLYQDNAFEYWSWEWVPGQQVDQIELPLRAGAIAGVIYASYLSDGEHRIRFNPHHSINLLLAEKEFKVSSQK